MTVRNRVLPLVVCLAMLALPAFAQQNSSVTQADVQRLQDNVYLADRDISQLRGRDATRANQLGTELDDLRDEVVYLKVKLRKERTLSRVEYADVRIESRISGRGRAATARLQRLRSARRHPRLVLQLPLHLLRHRRHPRRRRRPRGRRPASALSKFQSGRKLMFVFRTH